MKLVEALVLDHETHEDSASTWGKRSGDWCTETMNALPKYVDSRTLTEGSWNAEVLAGDAVEEIGGLKASGEGTLPKFGTGEFSKAPTGGGQLDEPHMWLLEFVAGAEGAASARSGPSRRHWRT